MDSVVNTSPIPELLAPAGERDAAYAAFEYGADAVYLGLRQFSARAEATNFSLEELAELVGFAHSQSPPRRVYVTLNTLLLERELPEMIETVLALQEIGVDALIVQDLGIIRLVREHAARLRLHASTQMAIHNREGLEAARSLGIRRAVLARELTLAEIRDIAAIPDIETEVFVHGALCYSYSGLCLLSSHACGRSGNRGKCAYLCRNHFTVSTQRTRRVPVAAEDGLLLSMNDLALRDTVGQLAAANVNALKIEGRMKTPRYVAATTHLYRRLLDGDLSKDEQARIEGDIATIFSRPWTQLYSHGRNPRNVVSTSQLGHLGFPIGRAEKVVEAQGKQDCVRFRVIDRELERHDGLQIAIPGRPRPYGFAVEKLWQVTSSGRTSEFRAPPGTLVDVELPARHPLISPGATVYCASSLAVRRRYTWSSPKKGATQQKLPLQVTVSAHAERLEFSVSSCRPGALLPTDLTLTINGEFPPARTPGQLEAALVKSFSRLGDTPFALDTLTVTGDTQRFVPISQLNPIRRDITARLTEKLLHERRQEAADVIARLTVGAPPARPQTAPSWHVKIDRIAYVDALLDVAAPDELIVDISRDSLDAIQGFLASTSNAPLPDLRLALPIIIRAWEREEILCRINALLERGYQRWQVADLAGLTMLSTAANRHGLTELDLSADWPLYVTNHLAAEQLHDMGFGNITLSPEAGLRDLHDILAALRCPAEIIVYQDTPLCISEVCLGSARNTCTRNCAVCPDNQSEIILSSKSTPDLIALQDRARTVLLSRNPLSFSGRLEELKASGAGCLRADFAWRRYSPEEIRDIWARLRSNTPINHTHAANFDRGLD